MYVISVVNGCCFNKFVLAELSPSFIRQEIEDGSNDVYKICYRDQSITIAANNATENDAKLANYIDINRVSYLSDGKVLNATLWLVSGFDVTDLIKQDKTLVQVSFGILIDVNPSPDMGAGSVGYHKEITKPSPSDIPESILHIKSNNSWVEDIHEALSFGPHRYLKAEERNYTKLFEEGQNKSFEKTAYYIPLSLNLNSINSPDKYKVMFYTLVDLNDDKCGLKRIVDFTNWIDIPPPKFFMSTFPNVVEFRPGQNGYVSGILKTTTGLVPNVTKFTDDETHSIIKIHPENTSYESTYGIHNALFRVEVPHIIQKGEYTISIKPTISTGSNIPSEFISVKGFNITNIKGSNITTGNMANMANMTIRVLEPLKEFSFWDNFGKQVKSFWDTFGQPISLIGGGFAAGFASLTFDRIKNRKKVKYKKLG